MQQKFCSAKTTKQRKPEVLNHGKTNQMEHFNRSDGRIPV